MTVVDPNFVFGLLELRYEVYEGKINKSKRGAPLEEVEIVFKQPATHNNTIDAEVAESETPQVRDP